MSANYTKAMLQNKLQHSHWPYNTNTEGLRENFNKLFYRVISVNFATGCSYFFSQKSSKSAKGLQLFFSTPFENFDFPCFQEV